MANALDSTTSLYTAIKDYKNIGVEDYQRPYAWDPENIEEFFEDLKEVAVTGQRHFFGTLILQKDTKTDGRVSVVDGQQRLTTSFMLVAILRDEIDELGLHVIPADGNLLPVDVTRIATDFLLPGRKTDEYRFQSSRSMRPILFSNVFATNARKTELPKRDTENKNLTLKLRAAIKTLRELVRADIDYKLVDEVKVPRDREEKLLRIHELLIAITENFTVLELSTKDTNESLELFLTMNNRGLDLGPSDIVRGQIMSNLGWGKSDGDQRKIQEDIWNDWDEISRLVKEPETFLRHYLLATSKDETEKIQKKKVVRAVELRIGSSSPEDRIKKTSEFWSDLLASARYYSEIVQPIMGGDCQYHLELMNGLSKSQRIFLLEVFRKELPAKTRDEFVRLVFVITYRWILSGKNAQRMEDKFQSLAIQMRGNLSPDDVLENLKDQVTLLDFDALSTFTTEMDSSFASRALLHYINKKTGPQSTVIPLVGDNFHLEHIAPQSGQNDWIQIFYSNVETNFKRYNSDISGLGNLTLLDPKKNKGIKDAGFDVKREAYQGSVALITRDLANFRDWNFEMVELRTKWLVHCFQLLVGLEPAPEHLDDFSTWYKKNPQS